MIRIRTHLCGLAAGLALAGCASAPLHYYTLVAPAGARDPSATASPLSFELMPVNVPAQVDQPQLVVRQGGQGVALLGSERWIAPLADEVRSALSADLVRQLPGADLSGMAAGEKPRLRIKLDVRRFDSAPGAYALIDAAWSVRAAAGDSPATVACTTRVRETVGPGYPALVQGHQRAVAQIAAQIATAARALAAGQSAACPAS
ncbi:PqiC family protein [Rhodanobacter caeni]|uniref:PqiC family protein n=1 Tax=Rhodanobacter caeni TaxID=657654 RepID=A0ABP3EAJ1_9GAMM